MKMIKRTIQILAFIGFVIHSSCQSTDNEVQEEEGVNEMNGLRFIDEYIIPDGELFDNTEIGGLSGIDYVNGTWYMISDAGNAPIRFYTADIDFDENGFNSFEITNVIELKDASGASFANGIVDPESIRVTPNGNLVWSSEGNVDEGVDPAVLFASVDGTYISEATLADKFKVSEDEESGPRHNAVFEGLSLEHSGNGYWVATEHPLLQDGRAPGIQDTESPVRIANINEDGTFGKEFAYELDPVARRASVFSITVSGLVEILEYDEDKFFVLERSFSTGFSDGGNTVKIYDVDASLATDVSSIEALAGASFEKATKTLLFDFETIRDQLTNGVVDNIEGITFGPELENGKRSLVVVADNNFSSFGAQLNQFILLEIE